MISMIFLVISIRKNYVFANIGPRLTNLIRWIGLSTYPLYLIHQPFSAPFMGALLEHGFNPWLVLCIGIAANVILAIGIAVFAEPFVRIRFERLIDPLFKYLPTNKWELGRGRNPLEKI
jgi:peptidoglycan/LPS O-acetylase OafA/YrhL